MDASGFDGIDDDTFALYDEFGNYVGPERVADTLLQPEDPSLNNNTINAQPPHTRTVNNFSANSGVVLYEDRQLFASAAQTYGPGVDVMVQDEDIQPLNEPIVAPVKALPKANPAPPLKHGSSEYLAFLAASCPVSRTHAVAVVGSLGHGKTSLMDVFYAASFATKSLLSATSQIEGAAKGTAYDPITGMSFTSTTNDQPEALRAESAWCGGGPRHGPHWMDSLGVERERGLTLLAKPLTCLLPDALGTSHVVHFIDCPGHADFHADQVSVTLEHLVDHMLLVVDVVDGLTLVGERAVREAMSLGLPLTLVLNKLDRLVLELCMPPNDAYIKINHVINSINTFIDGFSATATVTAATTPYFSPVAGNVLFACSGFHVLFSLQSFSEHFLKTALRHQQQHQRQRKTNLDFAKKLWGDTWYDPGAGTFSSSPHGNNRRRTFCHVCPGAHVQGHLGSHRPRHSNESLFSTVWRQKEPSKG